MTTIRKAFVAAALLLSSQFLTLNSVEAQVSLDWHGFVNPHYYADSRSVVGGREDMMLFYPKPILLDSLGNDLNDGWQANMLAITARLGLRITGPDMLGAKTSAYIEGDFTGSTNATINNLRLRHAYLTLDWERHRLVAGQFWHPMVVHEIMPMTNPLNMGAPFHPYSRQPQVRYEFRSNKWEAVAVALWQLDNMSQGLLDGQPASSTLFARHSLVPELNAQLRYRSRRWLLGVACNVKTIQPRVPDPQGELYSSPTVSLFGSYSGNHINIKVQTLLHNTLYEIASMGGYSLYHNTRTDLWFTIDQTFNTLWMDIERSHGHWRPGLFAGVGADMTPSYDLHEPENLTVYQFGRAFEFGALWRIQPRLTYKTLKGLDFTAEAEYTRVRYYDDLAAVGNLRLSLSMTYAF